MNIKREVRLSAAAVILLVWVGLALAAYGLISGFMPRGEAISRWDRQYLYNDHAGKQLDRIEDTVKSNSNKLKMKGP